MARQPAACVAHHVGGGRSSPGQPSAPSCAGIHPELHAPKCAQVPQKARAELLARQVNEVTVADRRADSRLRVGGQFLEAAEKGLAEICRTEQRQVALRADAVKEMRRRCRGQAAQGIKLVKTISQSTCDFTQTIIAAGRRCSRGWMDTHSLLIPGAHRSIVVASKPRDQPELAVPAPQAELRTAIKGPMAPPLPARHTFSSRCSRSHELITCW
jgi:hypothetical protein